MRTCVHPNLVHLHELVASEGDDVFFTMELVEGTDFLGHVQLPGRLAPPAGGRTRTITIDTTRRARKVFANGDRRARAGLDAARRLRTPTSRSCAPRSGSSSRACSALHAAGKLHRDIKPSNVRVTPEGRVVLLDFGVATELKRRPDGGRRRRRVRGHGHVHGAGAGHRRDAARRLRLVQRRRPALRGHRRQPSLRRIGRRRADPQVDHGGDGAVRLRRRRARGPRRVMRRAPGARSRRPARCRRDHAPPRRPGPERSRRGRTGRGEPRVDPLRGPGAGAASSAATRSKRCAQGRFVAVRIAGLTGLGKSSLVHHYLNELQAREGPGEILVLRGRVYERESMPYKAIDSVIDALTAPPHGAPRSAAPGRRRGARASLPRAPPLAGDRRAPEDRDRRSAGAAAARVRRAARAPRDPVRAAAGRRLHRRRAMGRHRQRGAPRGGDAASRCAADLAGDDAPLGSVGGEPLSRGPARAMAGGRRGPRDRRSSRSPSTTRAPWLQRSWVRSRRPATRSPTPSRSNPAAARS